MHNVSSTSLVWLPCTFLVLGQKGENGSLDVYRQVYDVLVPFTHPEKLEADIVDIVFLDSPRVPLELKFHIIRHGKVIFDGDPRRRLNAEAYIMEAYCDFRPLLDMFDQAVLARI